MLLKSMMFVLTCALAAPAFAQGTAGPRACVGLAREASRILRDELLMTETTLRFPWQTVCSQQTLDNRVPLLDAVRAAVGSFLDDDRDAESPLAIVLETTGGDRVAARASLSALLASPRSMLRLLPRSERPEHGERVDDAWIIQLRLPELSDHVFWAVIDREGTKPVYNYGFN